MSSTASVVALFMQDCLQRKCWDTWDSFYGTLFNFYPAHHQLIEPGPWLYLIVMDINESLFLDRAHTCRRRRPVKLISTRTASRLELHLWLDYRIVSSTTSTTGSTTTQAGGTSKWSSLTPTCLVKIQQVINSKYDAALFYPVNVHEDHLLVP